MTQRRKRPQAKAIRSAKTRARSSGGALLALEDLNEQPAVEVEALAANTSAVPRPSAVRDPYVYLILILPILVLLRNTSPIYTPAGYLDPWIYYGYMKHLVPFKGSLFPGTYYGSRLSWVLPGALVHSILRPVPANYVLHLTVLFTVVFSVYWLLKEAVDRRIAILSAICLALYPYFWEAVGWDYVDGVGIAYYLLAMALLFAAARRRNNRNRWLLAGAGMAYAGLIYSNIVWMAFSPSFLALYLWRAPGELTVSKFLKHAFRFLLWFGIGLAAVSVILGVINWRLEGGIRFYSPSWNYAVSTVGAKNPWKAPNYNWIKTGYWLILPAFACVGALVTCIQASWKLVRGDMRVFFALNLLYSAGVLVYMEAAGRPALQLFYYASYLIPGSILALGAGLFEGTSSLSVTRFRLTIAGALVGLLCVWVFITIPVFITFVMQHANGLFLAGMGMTAAGILLRRRAAGAVLGLAGLTFFCACSRAVNFPASEGADSFRRISAGMEAVEDARAGHPVRFWFNQSDPFSAEFHSLNSCYLWGYTYINFQFPVLEKAAVLGDGTFIVVPSSKPDVTEEAKGALASRGSVLRLLGKERLLASGKGYWLHFFRVEPDRVHMIPLQISFDTSGFGHLEAPPDGTAPAALPNDLWSKPSTTGAAGSLKMTPEGVSVETPARPEAWSSIYPELIAPEGALYRFVLTYRLNTGDPGFGALKQDMSGWYEKASRLYRTGPDVVKEFDVSLGADQHIQLATSNDLGVPAPSRYVIKELRAYRHARITQ